MRLELPSDRYRSSSQQRDLYRALNERLHAIPAASSVTLAGALPGTGGPLRKLAIDGRDGGPAAAPLIQTISVDQGYFATVGITLSEGRSFTDTDGLPGRPVAIVNEQFTRAYFKDGSPIGRRIALSEGDGPPGPWLTIVGVSPTVRQGTPVPVPVVYVPLSFIPVPSPVILIRTRDTPPSIGEAAREAVRRIDSTLAVYRVQSFEQASWEARWNARLSALLITSVALIALGLSSAGLWSLSWHGVALRRQEIGVRMALGSQPEQITTLIVSESLRQVAYGAACGCLLTLVWERLFASPHTFFTLTNLLMVNAFLAVMALTMSLWPARHASRLDPLTAIRHE
jgi:putative ABC transport system permease protein